MTKVLTIPASCLKSKAARNVRVCEFVRVLTRTIGLLVLVGCWAGAADASSFVTVGAPRSGASPSVVVLGQSTASVDVVTLPAQAIDSSLAVAEVEHALPHHFDPADSAIVTLSRSVVAVGEPEVTDEKVAAIDEKPWRRDPIPMVIRGGVVGGAYSPPAPAAAEPPKTSNQSAQAPDGSGKPEQPVPEPPKNAVAPPYAQKPQ
jgi:hypothetical protein